MKKYMVILRNCNLFENMENENITAMLSCLGAEVRSYTKDQYIYTEGEMAYHIGITLSGTAQTCSHVHKKTLNIECHIIL